MNKSELEFIGKHIGIKIKYGIPNFLSERRYNRSVSRTEQSEHEEEAENFLGDAMHFLSQDTSALLSPLRPDTLQLNILNSAFSNINNQVKMTKDVFKYNNVPHDSSFHLQYTTDEPLPSFVPKELQPLHETTIGTTWDVATHFPYNFSVTGTRLVIDHIDNDLKNERRELEFLVSPIKIEEQEDLPDSLQHLGEDNQSRTIIIGTGNRIISTSHFVSKGEEHTIVDQYHYLGDFNNSESAVQYYVYGINRNRSEIKSKPTTSEKIIFSPSLALQ